MIVNLLASIVFVVFPCWASLQGNQNVRDLQSEILQQTLSNEFTKILSGRELERWCGIQFTKFTHWFPNQ